MNNNQLDELKRQLVNSIERGFRDIVQHKLTTIIVTAFDPALPQVAAVVVIDLNKQARILANGFATMMAVANGSTHIATFDPLTPTNPNTQNN